jgi:hypothetical protein
VIIIPEKNIAIVSNGTTNPNGNLDKGDGIPAYEAIRKLRELILRVRNR